MKPCWPVHTFKNCLQHDSGQNTGETFQVRFFVFWAKYTPLASQWVPFYGLGDQSFWNVSPEIWTPDLIVGLIPDFSLCTDPLFPSGKIGVGRGVCTKATGFQRIGFRISQAGKNFLDSGIGITLHRGDHLHITTMSIFNLKHCPPEALKNLLWAPGVLVRFNSVCLIIL